MAAAAVSCSTFSLPLIHVLVVAPSLLVAQLESLPQIIPFLCLPAAISGSTHGTHSAATQRRHVASQRRGQASHPPRVLSTRHHSQLSRARCPPRSCGWQANCAALAFVLGWHACLAGTAGGQRQTTCAEQSTSQPTRTRPHPCRQPRASRHSLHRVAAGGAPENRHRGFPPFAAALRQGGAGRPRQTKREENSR